MVGISRLHLKLLRDIKAARLQFGAVVLIILLGVITFVGLYESYLNLRVSYDTTFERLKMADYWISVDQVGEKAIRDMNSIPGVTAIGRIVGEVGIDLENESGEKVTARVISLPPERHPPVNSLLVETGSYFTPSSRWEVLVGERFADYHGFEPGGRLEIERDGAKASFTIAGIVTSPEFIWVARSEQEPMPPPRTFGILFMPQPVVESLFDMSGRFNEIVLKMAPGVDHEKALAEIKRILHNNNIARVTSRDELADIGTRKSDIAEGVRSAYVTARKDQVTVRMLRQDLDGFASLAFLFPMLFLSMASLTIYVLMNRLIESQRIQIGIMRAIGYSRAAVLRHYLEFGLFVGAIGSLLGSISGHFLSSIFTGFYVDQLNLPYTVIATHWDTVVAGIAVGTAVPLLAGLVSSWSTLAVRPAEAMRPPAPVTGNRGLLRVSGILLRWLPYMLKLPVRNIIRNVRRSLFMALGVVSAVVMVIMAMSFVDAMEQLIHTQYEVIQKYDARIILQGMGAASTANHVGNLAGIRAAEAVLEVPYRIRYGENWIDSSIMGLPRQSSMYGLVTPEGNPVDVVDDGILLPSSFRARLQARVGDVLKLEPLVGTVGETEKRLAGFLDFPIGARGFMPLAEVQKMLRQPGTATSVFVRFDGEPSTYLMERLYDIPQVTSMELVQDTRQLIDESMGFFWVFIGVMLLMGGALGTAIIFNGITVNVLQRTREIAIMRAVGMHRMELTAILTLENLAIGFIGILMGIPAGRYVSQYLMDSMSTSVEDLFSFSLVILPRTYWFAAVFAMVILLVSQLPAIRQVTQLSLATATKEWSE